MVFGDDFHGGYHAFAQWVVFLPQSCLFPQAIMSFSKSCLLMGSGGWTLLVLLLKKELMSDEMHKAAAKFGGVAKSAGFRVQAQSSSGPRPEDELGSCALPAQLGIMPPRASARSVRRRPKRRRCTSGAWPRPWPPPASAWLAWRGCRAAR